LEKQDFERMGESRVFADGSFPAFCASSLSSRIIFSDQ
jgi:hypothetical protein